MTVPTPIQQRIRILDARGVSWRRISKEVGVSRQTVRKYAQLEDCSPEPPARPAAVSKLDPYKPLIGKWLEADRFMPRKQRHTARRVYDRLVEEQGFDGSYQIVQRYVKRWRQEHRLPGDGYLELEWSPGVMQADFGLAQAVVAGSRTDVHCLVASFPYSNMRYAVALPGENAECVCEGLLEVFEHIGAVPPVLVLDNATGAAHRVSWDRIVVVEVFQRFVAHHRIEVRFCNPGAGNEKGSVENAVGFLRRNVMVPLPNAESHAQLTRFMLSRCDRIAEDPHYRKGEPVRDLFARDSGGDGPDAWNPVRRVPVGGAQGRWRGMRERGLAPLSRGSVVARGGRSTSGCARSMWRSAPMTGAGSASCPAPTAGDTGTVRDPAVLLPALARKPRAWGESPIRADFPDRLRLSIDAMESRERQRTLRLIHRASESAGFDAAARAAEHLVEQGRGIDEASLMTLARRIAAGETPHDEPAPDLHDYDRFMRPSDDRKEA